MAYSMPLGMPGRRKKGTVCIVGEVSQKLENLAEMKDLVVEHVRYSKVWAIMIQDSMFSESSTIYLLARCGISIPWLDGWCSLRGIDDSCTRLLYFFS